MALVLDIGGDDLTSRLLYETLRISQTSDGLNSTCEFNLIDEDRLATNIWTVEETRVETDGDRISYYTSWLPVTKVEVTIADGGVTYFAGILSRMTSEPLGAKSSASVRCECCDFNIMLEESVIDDIVTWGAQTDEELIDLIWAAGYVAGVGKDAHVVGSGIVFDEVSFENQTVRQALDTIASFCDCQWYVDYAKELHYSTGGDAAPAWSYSGLPNDVTTFGYFDDITRELDSTNLVNMVFIVGGPTGLWFFDAASRAAYNDHKAIVRDTSLVDIDDMEERGNAILAKFKDPIVTYRFKSYTGADLHAGQSILLSCPLYDVDEVFLINSITITFPSDGTPVFEIVCGGLDSGASASAARSLDDAVNDSQGYVPSGALCLASQGWSHDITFTATDFETVEWAVGTITTAGGQSIAVQAGDTDVAGVPMAAKTIVFLDMIRDPVTPHELFKTTTDTDALGNNRVMVAVCWPGIAAAGAQPEVLAGFQVFGASVELQTFLNADNIIANCITANEIYVNSLSAIVANMGILTAGVIQTAAAGNNRVVISAADGVIVLNAADEIQVQMEAATGIMYCGERAVTLDADGISIDYGVAFLNRISFMDGATERGYLWGLEVGTEHHMRLVAGPCNVGDNASLRLWALDSGGDATYIEINSKGAVGEYIMLGTDAGGAGLVVYPTNVKVFDDLVIGSLAGGGNRGIGVDNAGKIIPFP